MKNVPYSRKKFDEAVSLLDTQKFWLQTEMLKAIDKNDERKILELKGRVNSYIREVITFRKIKEEEGY